jgi:hypothetical protein
LAELESDALADGTLLGVRVVLPLDNRLLDSCAGRPTTWVSFYAHSRQCLVDGHTSLLIWCHLGAALVTVQAGADVLLRAREAPLLERPPDVARALALN